MVEVMEKLWCGDGRDWEYARFKEGWVYVHAAKEPWHREALGYRGKGADKNNQEYLYAIRGRELCLNMIDADDCKYVPEVMIDFALTWIDIGLKEGVNVLVHCNQGRSRSVGICMLYMAREGIFAGKPFFEAEEEMRKIYPMYEPKAGIREYMLRNWGKYNKGGNAGC